LAIPVIQAAKGGVALEDGERFSFRALRKNALWAAAALDVANDAFFPTR
jgi:hypothetical protein